MEGWDRIDAELEDTIEREQFPMKPLEFTCCLCSKVILIDECFVDGNEVRWDVCKECWNEET